MGPVCEYLMHCVCVLQNYLGLEYDIFVLDTLNALERLTFKFSFLSETCVTNP